MNLTVIGVRRIPRFAKTCIFIMKRNILFSLATVLLLSCNRNPQRTEEPDNKIDRVSSSVDPLPSWNEGIPKKSIIDFVTRTTTEGNEDFVPVAERIACFDNDGTLWCEQPLYFQLFFAIDRIKAMAPQHPEWKTNLPYKALLEGDMKTVMAGGEKALLEIIMSTHSGMTTDEFERTVNDWMSTATHPKTGRQFNEMIYQPMIELLRYLESYDYKIFVVSGSE